jgi:hypothetical protein
MKLKDLKNLVMPVFVERFTKLGYVRDGGIRDDWYIKHRSKDLKIGIWPQFFSTNRSWKVVFNFGGYYLPFEQQMDQLEARGAFTNKWTFIVRNKNFPAEYTSFQKYEDTIGSIVTILPFNNRFEAALTEQEIIDRANFNINVVEEYSLPWLENLDEKGVLEEVKTGDDPMKKIIAYFYESNFAKVETSISEFKKRRTDSH